MGFCRPESLKAVVDFEGGLKTARRRWGELAPLVKGSATDSFS